MELNYSRKEKAVGIFVALICMLLLSTIIILGRGKNWFQEYHTYYTTFDESYNLKVGADVKLFKTNIGKVKSISVETKVRVKLAILAKYESRIRTNTVTIVESPTFVGSEYISIIPGSADASLLPQEGEIPSRAKKSIADLLAEFEVEKTAKKFVLAIQNFADFTQTLKEYKWPLMSALENIDNTTQHVETITKSIEAGDGTLGNLLMSTDLLDAVLSRLDNLDRILDDLYNASSKTPGIIDSLQNSLAGIPEIMDSIAESTLILNKILSEVEKNIPTIQAILENTEKGSRDVPKITTSVTQILQEARNEIENVDKVIHSLQNNFLIKPNLPPEPVGKNTDTGLRR